MSQTSIRLVRTPDIDKVISYLRVRYNLLSEAEIIKLALSEKYQKERENAVESEQKLREAFKHAMEEGRKVGDKLMKEKGLDPKKVTEQEFYDTFLDTHKHGA